MRSPFLTECRCFWASGFLTPLQTVILSFTSASKLKFAGSSLNSQFMGVILQPLRDRVRLPVRVLFVGINPGMRSAEIGHHFAGYSNRFWKLLFESGLVPEPIRSEDDVRLPEWGFGITNLIARPPPGIDTLRPPEYGAGERILRRKVRRWRPRVVVFVGVTLYRSLVGRPA